MADATPSISMTKGFSIGYRTPLARSTSEIRLGSGTHFLLARNGRGKTTLLRTIARSLKPLQGAVHSSGRMQYLPEDLRFDAEIPVHSIFRALLAKDRFEAAMDLAGRIELDTNKAYGRLSTGNRRKTSLIVAEFSTLPDTPNILLLDEPFSGLDAFARETFEMIWKSSAANVLRLVSCHPDYDTMSMPSAVLIQDETVSHQEGSHLTWSNLKKQLN